MKKIFIALIFASMTFSCQAYNEIIGTEKEQKVDGGKRMPMLNNRSAMPPGGNLNRSPVFAPPPASANAVAPDPRGIVAPQPPRSPLVITQNSNKVNPYGNTQLPNNRRAPAFNNQALRSALPVPAPVPQVSAAPSLPSGNLPTGSAIANIPSAPAAPTQVTAAFIPPPPPPAFSAPPLANKEFPKLSQIPPAPVPPKPASMDARVANLKADLNQAKQSRMNSFEAPVPPSKVEVQTSSVVTPVIPAPPITPPAMPSAPKTNLSDLRPIEQSSSTAVATAQIQRSAPRQAITTLSDLRPPRGGRPSFGLGRSRYQGVDRASLARSDRGDSRSNRVSTRHSSSARSF